MAILQHSRCHSQDGTGWGNYWRAKGMVLLTAMYTPGTFFGFAIVHCADGVGESGQSESQSWINPNYKCYGEGHLPIALLGWVSVALYTAMHFGRMGMLRYQRATTSDNFTRQFSMLPWINGSKRTSQTGDRQAFGVARPAMCHGIYSPR